jgi:hypothetical protein
MKPVAREIFGMAKRRGLWLRCFLGGEEIECLEEGSNGEIS